MELPVIGSPEEPAQLARFDCGTGRGRGSGTLVVLMGLLSNPKFSQRVQELSKKALDLLRWSLGRSLSSHLPTAHLTAARPPLFEAAASRDCRGRSVALLFLPRLLRVARA